MLMAITNPTGYTFLQVIFFCIGQSTGRLYMATSMNPQNYISGGFRILANYFWLNSEVWKELCLFLHMYILHILFSSAL